MSRVVFDRITKHFGEVVAVDDLSLEIYDQEFLVLLGPSGCGKSTALRIVAGLEQPTRGTIIIGDRVVNNIEAKNRDIAMVFQDYALYPHMSVYDNMAFEHAHAARSPAGAAPGGCWRQPTPWDWRPC